MGERRRDTTFKLPPVLYRRNFNRHGRADARSSVFEIPTRSDPKFGDCGSLLFNRLREGGSGKEKQGCDQDGSFRVHHALSERLHRGFERPGLTPLLALWLSQRLS